MRRVALIAAIVLALTACGGDVVSDPDEALPPNTGAEPPAEQPTIEREDRPVPTLERVEPLPDPITGEVPDHILEPVLEDASERSGVAIEDLVVIRAEFVEWPDGSLGCPEPGMSYTQAIVPGYRVEIEADGQNLDYRLDGSGGFRLCDGTIQSPSEGGVPTTTGSSPDS